MAETMALLLAVYHRFVLIVKERSCTNSIVHSDKGIDQEFYNRFL